MINFSSRESTAILLLKLITHTHRHITAGGAYTAAVGAVASVGEVLEGGIQ